MFALFVLSAFRAMLAADWSEQCDQEHALAELDDRDGWGIIVVKQHYRRRLIARLQRLEE